MPSVNGQVRLPATAGRWVAVKLDVRLYLRDEITPVTFLVALKQGLQATVRGMTDFPCHP